MHLYYVIPVSFLAGVASAAGIATLTARYYMRHPAKAMHLLMGMGSKRKKNGNSV